MAHYPTGIGYGGDSYTRTPTRTKGQPMASDWSNATDADVNAEIADRLYARAFLPARNDFATSLDAMAGAEATMDGGEWVRYITALYPKGKEYRETGFRDIRSLMSASARQLAVAFLAASANRKENS